MNRQTVLALARAHGWKRDDLDTLAAILCASSDEYALLAAEINGSPQEVLGRLAIRFEPGQRVAYFGSDKNFLGLEFFVDKWFFEASIVCEISPVTGKPTEHRHMFGNLYLKPTN